MEEQKNTAPEDLRHAERMFSIYNPKHIEPTDIYQMKDYLRQELRQEINYLRKDLRQEIDYLRQEMGQESCSLRKETRSLNLDISKLWFWLLMSCIVIVMFLTLLTYVLVLRLQ